MRNEEKTHAMLCHLLSFTVYVGIPFGNVLGPLIMWLVSKDKSAFVDRHGKAAVNFQLSMLIYTILSIILCFILIGFLLLAGIFVIHLVFGIIACVKAYNGEEFEYPLSIPFIS